MLSESIKIEKINKNKKSLSMSFKESISKKITYLNSQMLPENKFLKNQ
jgi:hypothetical protein